MSRFLNDRIAALDAYVPGEQPRDRRYVKLNTNESPYPPSPAVLAAVNTDAVASLRLYCDPTAKALTEALAARYGVSPKQIFTANGSDDILNFAFLAYGQAGVTFADITYGFYGVFAALHGLTAEVVPLREDFTLDIPRFCGRRGLVAIANPNAPTGIALSRDTIEEIVRANPNAVVLVDEAYVDFGGESAVPLCEKYDNLLCVQTFSKSRSMAGGRLGFAVANEALISDLEKIKYSTNPYNINTLTQIAGVATLSDDAYTRENCQKIIATRERTTAELRARGFTVLPSAANFIFARHARISGADYYAELRARGVLVRHFTTPRIADFNRISIGSDAEMDALLRATDEILGAPEHR